MPLRTAHRCSMCTTPLVSFPGGAKLCPHCDASSHVPFLCRLCRVGQDYEGSGPRRFR